MSDASIVRRAFTKQAEGEGSFAKALSEAVSKLNSPNLLAQGEGFGSRVLAGAKNYYKGLDPVSQAALIGSLTGAGVGGLGNLAFGNKRKGALSRLAMGAAAGGLGGAFFGPAQYYGSELAKKIAPGLMSAKPALQGPPSAMSRYINSERSLEPSNTSPLNRKPTGYKDILPNREDMI